MLRLHDTAAGGPVDFEPRRPGEVSMYVCGPTVYDDPHIGHARFALVYDVLRRYLESSGLRVVHVSNVTDIDDKIIARARQLDLSPAEVAARYEKSWYDSLDRLNILRPSADPHASAYIDAMVEWISALTEGGHAYETSDGVYLAVETVAGYGLLARQSLESLRSGARVEVIAEKRSPLDFALWKKAKPAEPQWPSPWGPGRPGWHTECVVMALDLLGEGFDIHGGGQDLAFPHHENERAQAVAAGRSFANHWMHNGFVESGGAKMSKSLGNFTTLVDLLDSTDPRAYRLLVLRSHYRAPLAVTSETLSDAERALARLDDFARRSAELPAATPDPTAMAAFTRRMDDDLDTPTAVADLFDLVRRVNTAVDAGDPIAAAPLAAAVRWISQAVGLPLAGGDDVDDAAAELIARRDAARAASDFSAADAIRDELVAKGWVVEDGSGGTRVHRRSP